jgi:hypothetical protein
MRRLVVGLIVLVSVACGPRLVWERPGTTDAAVREDDAECRWRATVDEMVPTVVQSARRPDDQWVELRPRRRFDFEAYRRCMTDRGYRLEPVSPSGE